MAGEPPTVEGSGGPPQQIEAGATGWPPQCRKDKTKTIMLRPTRSARAEWPGRTPRSAKTSG